MSEALLRTLPGREALAEALARVAGGDRGALHFLYRQTSAKLFGVCLRILDNRSEAEDVLQEAYLTIWQKAGSFDPERASPVTWLAAIARNKAIDRRRQRSARQADPLGEEAEEVADPAPSAAARLETADERRLLSECMGALDERQASAIRTAFFEGTTYAELALRQGVPAGTMKSWIRRGLLRLRECLGG